MDNRIQDFTSALERDKAPVYYLGVICVSIGFQIHAFTMASAGMLMYVAGADFMKGLRLSPVSG